MAAVFRQQFGRSARFARQARDESAQIGFRWCREPQRAALRIKPGGFELASWIQPSLKGTKRAHIEKMSEKNGNKK